MHLVVSSSNRNKVLELQKLGLPYQSFTLDQVMNPVPEFIEDGATFEENAIKKLQGLPLMSDRIYLSDDSGLEVNALGGGPGIYSARYAGVGATGQQMCHKILEATSGFQDRGARFVCVIALLFPSGKIETFRGTVSGVLAPHMRGESGFGYDPIFIPEGYTLTYGELGDSVKSETSHRAQALKQVKHRLQANLDL
jgi:non-canonical purine NTP pyrophosphatase (RdgB/HAM1 family)